MPTLVPGNGDWSTVNTYIAGLGQLGSGGHWDAYKPIARWRATHGGVRVVPHVTITGTFYVGVAAVHGAGMTRVRFSLEGGAFTDVSAMSANPDTGEWAYWVDVDGASLSDAEDYEVVAIAEPVEGYARVFQGAIDDSVNSTRDGQHSFWFSANHGGTLSETEVWVDSVSGNDGNPGTSGSPFATLQQAMDTLRSGSDFSGGIVNLKAGQYTAPNASSPIIDNARFFTVRRDPNAVALSAEINDTLTNNRPG